MLKRLVPVFLVLVTATCAFAQTTVTHVTDRVTGWRGGNNRSASACWLDSWPNGGAWGGYQDATLAEFDRAALRTAIEATIDSLGTMRSWDARVIVTQPSWASTTDPKTLRPNLQPVVGVAQVDAATLNWAAALSINAGNGSWALNGTTYPTFGDAVMAGVATGVSTAFDIANWTTEANGTEWNVVLDVPEYLIVQYLKNTAATGIFASARTPNNEPLWIYQNQQPNVDIRILIQPPLMGWLPWMNAVIGGDTHALWVDRTIVEGGSAVNVSVRVDNASGWGTLSWTAAESPNVGWLSLTGASGGNGGTFTMALNPAGLTPGVYTTNVVISDEDSSENKSITIPVTLTVQANAPIIQLAPTSLSFQASPSGSNPASQAVTVNNIGSGTMTWTAAEYPTDYSWLSLTPASGSQGSTFTVSINKTGLAGGLHTATIRVSSPTAANSPVDLPVTLILADQDANITTANSYDDAWQGGASGWVATMQAVRAARPAGVTPTSGLVVLLGDSITYANPFSQWPRYGTGRTADDLAICTWMHSDNWGTGSNNSNNGWYLAAWDVSGRNGSFTARSGITAAGYLTGYGGLPSMDQMYTAGFTNPDGKQYRDAEIAVILLGTNDLGSRTDAELAADLNTMVDKLIANGIIPVLTTIPPRAGQDAKVLTFVAAIRNIAQTRKLPLIDFYQEIMRRRPGSTWQNTLISSDGVHPSSTSNSGLTSSSDPYLNNGQALSEVGYLLRSWLTVQKVKEVKDLVIDGQPVAPDAPSNPSPASGARSQAANLTLTWGTAAAGVTFDVYLGTTNPPTTRVATNITAASFSPADLAFKTQYYWYVVAKNSGGQTTGPVWSFATKIQADMNADGYVNVGDLQALVAAWGSTNTTNPPTANWNASADVNSDGYVNVGDLQTLVSMWGQSF